MKMKVLIAIGCLLFANSLFHPALVRSEVVEHSITATLSDGSEILGTFAVDSEATDDFVGLPTIGRFDLVNVNVSLIGTETLFISGGSTSTSGLATSGFLFQAADRQTIDFTFLSDDGISNAFTDGLEFGPYVGDFSTASPIQGEYLGQGFVDGNGGVNIVTASISIEEVPEPTGVATVALVLLFGSLKRFRP